MFSPFSILNLHTLSFCAESILMYDLWIFWTYAAWYWWLPIDRPWIYSLLLICCDMFALEIECITRKRYGQRMIYIVYEYWNTEWFFTENGCISKKFSWIDAELSTTKSFSYTKIYSFFLSKKNLKLVSWAFAIHHNKTLLT